MKNILFIILVFSGMTLINAQTKEELKAEQSSKNDSINILQKKADALQSQIDALPGWRIKAFGTIGGSISGSNNWYSKEIPNSSVGNFGLNINAYANLIEEDFFWKNASNVNISWVKYDNKDDNTDSKEYSVATDIFTLSSLYGRNLNKKFAISAYGEYRSSLVHNFNNPGFLDLGIGATWTPIKNLVVVINPLNYNMVFSRAGNIYESSLGTKIVADYKRSFGNLNIASNLSIFQSYKSSNYSNYTWTNSFAYTIWKNLGLGFDFGLRKNKQEALNYTLDSNPDATFDTIDNKLQSYWLFGLNYKLN